jgi:hypothetical protein
MVYYAIGPDHPMIRFEFAMRTAAPIIPDKRLDKFHEFHTFEIYHGFGPFEKVEAA